MNLPSWFWTILPFLCESRTPQEEADQERGRIEVGHLEVSEVIGIPSRHRVSFSTWWSIDDLGVALFQKTRIWFCFEHMAPPNEMLYHIKRQLLRGTSHFQSHTYARPPPHWWLENQKLACKARHFPKRRWWLDWGQDKKRRWWTIHIIQVHIACACLFNQEIRLGTKIRICVFIPWFPFSGVLYEAMPSFTVRIFSATSFQEFRRQMAKQVVYRWLLYVQDSDIVSVYKKNNE